MTKFKFFKDENFDKLEERMNKFFEWGEYRVVHVNMYFDPPRSLHPQGLLGSHDEGYSPEIYILVQYELK